MSVELIFCLLNGSQYQNGSRLLVHISTYLHTLSYVIHHYIIYVFAYNYETCHPKAPYAKVMELCEFGSVSDVLRRIARDHRDSRYMQSEYKLIYSDLHS